MNILMTRGPLRWRQRTVLRKRAWPMLGAGLGRGVREGGDGPLFVDDVGGELGDKGVERAGGSGEGVDMTHREGVRAWCAIFGQRSSYMNKNRTDGDGVRLGLADPMSVQLRARTARRVCAPRASTSTAGTTTSRAPRHRGCDRVSRLP